MMTQKYSLFDVCVCVYVGRWNAKRWSSFFLDATASFWWQRKVRATHKHTRIWLFVRLNKSCPNRFVHFNRVPNQFMRLWYDWVLWDWVCHHQPPPTHIHFWSTIGSIHRHYCWCRSFVNFYFDSMNSNCSNCLIWNYCYCYYYCLS